MRDKTPAVIPQNFINRVFRATPKYQGNLAASMSLMMQRPGGSNVIWSQAKPVPHAIAPQHVVQVLLCCAWIQMPQISTRRIITAAPCGAGLRAVMTPPIAAQWLSRTQTSVGGLS